MERFGVDKHTPPALRLAPLSRGEQKGEILLQQHGLQPNEK
jgi:hypothetical protein